MSNVSVDKIRALGSRMRTNATLKEVSPTTTHMTVQSEDVMAAFEEAGFSKDQVSQFGVAAGNATRALHCAATEVNIDRIKDAVSKGEDYRDLTVTASGNVGRGFAIRTEVRAEKTGTIKRGDKVIPWQTHNSGTPYVKIGAGMPTEITEELDAATKAAIKDSKFFEPVGSSK